MTCDHRSARPKWRARHDMVPSGRRDVGGQLHPLGPTASSAASAVVRRPLAAPRQGAGRLNRRASPLAGDDTKKSRQRAAAEVGADIHHSRLFNTVDHRAKEGHSARRNRGDGASTEQHRYPARILRQNIKRRTRAGHVTFEEANRFALHVYATIGDMPISGIRRTYPLRAD